MLPGASIVHDFCQGIQVFDAMIKIKIVLIIMIRFFKYLLLYSLKGGAA